MGWLEASRLCLSGRPGRGAGDWLQGKEPEESCGLELHFTLTLTACWSVSLSQGTKILKDCH